MKNRRPHYLSHIFLCVIFGQSIISAQNTTPVVPENQAPEQIVSEENLIHPGDLIDVDVVGSLEYDWRGGLTPEGFLSGIGYNESPVYALCRDEESVAAEVAKTYSKILREPKVVVRILDRSNRPISVLYGAVRTPQRFRINRPVFLNELIINSGGFTEKVSGEIQVFRPKNLNCLSAIKARSNINIDENADGEMCADFIDAVQNEDSEYTVIKIADLITGKKAANVQILSGDIITVLEAESVYVIGGVANPKQIPLRTQLTLSRAVASAGGLSKDAVAQSVTIYRRENKNTKMIEADLDKAKANPADDVALQASDIVEVAQKGRVKRKYPPIIQIADDAGKNTANLPLRIID